MNIISMCQNDKIVNPVIKMIIKTLSNFCFSTVACPVLSALLIDIYLLLTTQILRLLRLAHGVTRAG